MSPAFKAFSNSASTSSGDRAGIRFSFRTSAMLGRSRVRRQTGAASVLISARREHPMTRPVVHFEIRGKHPQPPAYFYRELFGWKIDGASPVGIMTVEHGIGGPEAGVGGHIRGAEAPGKKNFLRGLDHKESVRKGD